MISNRINYRIKSENMFFNIFILLLVIFAMSRNLPYGGAQDITDLRNLDNPDDVHVPVGPRTFEYCPCHQKLRTSYLTTDFCGQAALCYWEIWNYNRFKANITGDDYHEDCDQYMVQKYACLIGYPKPHYPNKACEPAVLKCDKVLAELLYKECEPLRQKRGLAKPEDVEWRVRTLDLNYNMTLDENTIFEAKPKSSAVTYNNYYTISCPIIYRFPYFTIDLLLRDLDPKYDEYDETLALGGVAHMLPRYVREGMNQERIQNFEALSLDESMINWCEIPTKYLCIKQELDPRGDICEWDKLNKLREKCEPTEAMPRPKPLTAVALPAGEVDVIELKNSTSSPNSTTIETTTVRKTTTTIKTTTPSGNAAVITTTTIKTTTPSGNAAVAGNNDTSGN